MEPWNLGSRLHKKGSMVPWFQGGTMEPWNHGTMEPKCVICLIVFDVSSIINSECSFVFLNE